MAKIRAVNQVSYHCLTSFCTSYRKVRPAVHHFITEGMVLVKGVVGLKDIGARKASAISEIDEKRHQQLAREKEIPPDKWNKNIN